MIARKLHTLILSTCLGILSCIFAGGIAVAEVRCELSVTVLDSDPLGYRSRGDRCEGRYVEKLSGSAIAVVSFTNAFADFDTDSGLSLDVSWTPPADAVTHLRARSLEPKIYFQMDTTRPTDERAFNWPVAVLDALDLDRDRLGVVGFYDEQIGGAAKSIHVPLEISQGRGDVPETELVLLARPGVQLHEVYMSLVALDASGREGSPIRDEEALDLGFYPAERAFQVPLPPDLPRPGLYHLTLAAEAAGTGNVLVEHVYFRLAP